MAQLKGFVTHIIYRNNGNGYTVFELISIQATRSPAWYISVSGRGRNFWSWREILPSTRCMGVSLKFLRSNSRRQRMRRGWRDISAPGRSKELGASLAARIVKRFGADTFRIVEEEPERLAEIKGDQRAQGDGYCIPDGRKARNAGSDGLILAEIRDFQHAGGADL